MSLVHQPLHHLHQFVHKKNDKAACVTTHRIDSSFSIQATPIATTTFQPPTALPPEFFCRPAQEVAPELIGCLLLKRQTGGELLGGVIVETEAYCQSEPACHGHRRRSPSNETLFGEPGHWYVYVSYGIHHCVKRVVDPGAAKGKSAQQSSAQHRS